MSEDTWTRWSHHKFQSSNLSSWPTWDQTIWLCWTRSELKESSKRLMKMNCQTFWTPSSQKADVPWKYDWKWIFLKNYLYFSSVSYLYNPLIMINFLSMIGFSFIKLFRFLLDLKKNTKDFFNGNKKIWILQFVILVPFLSNWFHLWTQTWKGSYFMPTMQQWFLWNQNKVHSPIKI